MNHMGKMEMIVNDRETIWFYPNLRVKIELMEKGCNVVYASLEVQRFINWVDIQKYCFGDHICRSFMPDVDELMAPSLMMWGCLLPPPLHQTTQLLTPWRQSVQLRRTRRGRRLRYPSVNMEDTLRKLEGKLSAHIYYFVYMALLAPPIYGLAKTQCNIFSWNCHGTGQNSFLPNLRLLLRECLPSIHFLYERQGLKLPTPHPTSNKSLDILAPSLSLAPANRATSYQLGQLLSPSPSQGSTPTISGAPSPHSALAHLCSSAQYTLTHIESIK